MNAFVQTVGFILGPGLIQYFLKNSLPENNNSLE